MSWQETHMEIRTYLALAQKNYAIAFGEGDVQGMVETSNELCLAYSAMGYATLASKWAEAYWHHLLDSVEKPSRL